LEGKLGSVEKIFEHKEEAKEVRETIKIGY